MGHPGCVHKSQTPLLRRHFYHALQCVFPSEPSVLSAPSRAACFPVTADGCLEGRELERGDLNWSQPRKGLWVMEEGNEKGEEAVRGERVKVRARLCYCPVLFLLCPHGMSKTPSHDPIHPTMTDSIFWNHETPNSLLPYVSSVRAYITQSRKVIKFNRKGLWGSGP